MYKLSKKLVIYTTKDALKHPMINMQSNIRQVLPLGAVRFLAARKSCHCGLSGSTSSSLSSSSWGVPRGISVPPPPASSSGRGSSTPSSSSATSADHGLLEALLLLLHHSIDQTLGIELRSLFKITSKITVAEVVRMADRGDGGP